MSHILFSPCKTCKPYNSPKSRFFPWGNSTEYLTVQLRFDSIQFMGIIFHLLSIVHLAICCWWPFTESIKLTFFQCDSRAIEFKLTMNPLSILLGTSARFELSRLCDFINAVNCVHIHLYTDTDIDDDDNNKVDEKTVINAFFNLRSIVDNFPRAHTVSQKSYIDRFGFAWREPSLNCPIEIYTLSV